MQLKARVYYKLIYWDFQKSGCRLKGQITNVTNGKLYEKVSSHKPPIYLQMIFGQQTTWEIEDKLIFWVNGWSSYTFKTGKTTSI